MIKRPVRDGMKSKTGLAAAPTLRKEGWTMRITFHVGKFTVTIIIRETHQKDRNEKNEEQP